MFDLHPGNQTRPTVDHVDHWTIVTTMNFIYKEIQHSILILRSRSPKHLRCIYICVICAISIYGSMEVNQQNSKTAANENILSSWWMIRESGVFLSCLIESTKNTNIIVSWWWLIGECRTYSYHDGEWLASGEFIFSSSHRFLNFCIHKQEFHNSDDGLSSQCEFLHSAFCILHSQSRDS